MGVLGCIDSLHAWLVGTSTRKCVVTSVRAPNRRSSAMEATRRPMPSVSAEPLPNSSTCGLTIHGSKSQSVVVSVLGLDLLVYTRTHHDERVLGGLPEDGVHLWSGVFRVVSGDVGQSVDCLLFIGLRWHKQAYLAEVDREGGLLHRNRLVAGDARVDAVHHADQGLGAGDEGPLLVFVGIMLK